MRLKYGNPETFQVRWYHVFLPLTFPLVVLGTMIMAVGVMLLSAISLDSCHFEFKVKAKTPEE